MRTERRTRRYVGRQWILFLRPFLRFSITRNAFILRGVGVRMGPVLRVERRRAHVYRPIERRGTQPFQHADSRRTRIA